MMNKHGHHVRWITLVSFSVLSNIIFAATDNDSYIKNSQFNPVENLEWTMPFEGNDIQFSSVSGQTFNSRHSTFGKFPATFTTPMHYHSNDYHGIVISGIMTNPMKGETKNVELLGPGSYWFVPALSVHETACISLEPCVFFMHQSTPFDFMPDDGEVKLKAYLQSQGVFTPAKNRQWFKPFENSPIEFSTAYGKTFELAHGTFVKFPKQFTTPIHTHGNTYQGIVLSGVISNPIQGETSPAKLLTQGSHWTVKGDKAHTTTCLSKEPCQFYIYQDAPFDFVEINHE